VRQTGKIRRLSHLTLYFGEKIRTKKATILLVSHDGDSSGTDDPALEHVSALLHKRHNTVVLAGIRHLAQGLVLSSVSTLIICMHAPTALTNLVGIELLADGIDQH
jgi:hypothetical protein